MSFVWASFSHSSCTPHASSSTLVHILFSFPPSSWFICLFVTKRGRNSTSCTFVGGESHRGDAYTKGEKTSFYEKNLFCLVLAYACFLVFFMVLWVIFNIYALLLSSHHAYVLDRHTSLCYCTLLVACSNDHLLCHMIIVVISIWLFYVWSSCSQFSHHVYLINIYLLHYTCPFITWFTLRV